MIGWHFAANWKLRDGQPLDVATYTVLPPLALGARGLHASERALDALRYAPPGMPCVVSRVELSGAIERDEDKVCASERRVLWAADCTDTLRAFALVVGTQALDRAAARGLTVDRRAYEVLRAAEAYRHGEASRVDLDAAAHGAWAARRTFYERYWSATAHAAIAAANVVTSPDPALAVFMAINAAVTSAAATAATSASFGTAARAAAAAGRACDVAMNDTLTAMLEALQIKAAARRVAILIPSSGERALANLARDAIARFTQDVPHDVFLLDHGPWDERGGEANALALRMLRGALDRAGAAGYSHVFIMHDDALPVRAGWLSYLLRQPLPAAAIVSRRSQRGHSAGTLFDVATFATMNLAPKMPEYDVAESVEPGWRATMLYQAAFRGHTCDVACDDRAIPFYVHLGGGTIGASAFKAGSRAQRQRLDSWITAMRTVLDR